MPSFNLLQQKCKPFPTVGRHIHIDPGEQRIGTIGCGASGDFGMAVPIADYKTVKAHFAAQNAGQKGFRAVHFLAIDAERGHHSLHLIINGGAIGMGVDFFDVTNTANSVALINAILRAAIADKMLGSGDDAFIAEEIITIGRPL